MIQLIWVSISLILLFASLPYLANDYIRKHRKELFEACKPLSEQCRSLGEKLAVQTPTFNEYIGDMGLRQTYNCSSSVVANAERNEVKYLLKYSSINNDVGSMEKLDFCIGVLNSLCIFQFKMEQLSKTACNQLPFLIKLFASKSRLPFLICNVDGGFNTLNSPSFTFLYVSPAGQSRREYKIPITSEILRAIQGELSLKIDKAGYAKAQRSAMTNDLREAIKKRDNYTCCICGNSVLQEPNLLLEVDHIIPISKGGKSEASNLQTLCWRCNREKSDK